MLRKSEDYCKMRDKESIHKMFMIIAAIFTSSDPT